MKTYLMCLFAAVALVVVAGCGSKAPEENIPEPQQAPQNAPIQPVELGGGGTAGAGGGAQASPGENPPPPDPPAGG